MRIIPYTPELKGLWDSLVDNSRNATFLLRRDYMDYHADRFPDRSLMVIDNHDRVIAALAATYPEADGVLKSHAGLTYGGLILDHSHSSMNVVMEAWELIMAHLRNEGFSGISYKAIPHIYHRYPSDEDLYLIFRAGGRIEETNISSTIDLNDPLPFDSNSSRAAKYALSHGVSVMENADYAGFWQVLTTLLRDRYGTTPVHTLDEISLLSRRFPHNIRLYTAIHEGSVIAGAVIYRTPTVAHAQYIAASDEGKRLKALPLLFAKAISDSTGDGCRYFDFGTSNENRGQYLNEGLSRQKNGMGGRGTAYITYYIPVS